MADGTPELRLDPRPLRERLPALSGDEAARRNAWLLALNGDGLSAAAIEGEGGPALRFSGEVWIVPEQVDGAPAAWLDAPSSPALPEALTVFSRLEPLLAAVERAAGFALDPLGLEPAPEGFALRLAYGEHVARLVLGPGARTPARRTGNRAPIGAAGCATVACAVVLEGPLAPAEELCTLAPGDLVIAPSSPDGIKGWLSAPGVGTVRMRLRPGSARGLCEGIMDSTLNAPPLEDAAAAAELPGGLKLRLRLELGGVEVTLAELAGLAPGAVLPVEALGDAPVVTITAPGATLATGRLVALGEGYGVLVDTVAATPA